jgi:hypothetical protein
VPESTQSKGNFPAINPPTAVADEKSLGLIGSAPAMSAQASAKRRAPEHFG